jgi:hypothetical protein
MYLAFFLKQVGKRPSFKIKKKLGYPDLFLTKTRCHYPASPRGLQYSIVSQDTRSDKNVHCTMYSIRKVQWVPGYMLACNRKRCQITSNVADFCMAPCYMTLMHVNACMTMVFRKGHDYKRCHCQDNSASTRTHAQSRNVARTY